MAVPLALPLFLGGAGLLAKYMNKPEDMDYNFDYDVEKASYDPSTGLMKSISDLRGAAGESMGAGREFMGAYRQMIDPGSAYYKRMFGELRKSTSDMAAQTRAGMDQTLASRGIGRGGMSSLLGSATTNQLSEGMRKGFVDIQGTGLGYASQFGGLANQGFATGIQGLGQVGGLQSDIDARALQTNLFNTGAMNQRNQYGNMMGYEQMVGNVNARSSWQDSLGSSLFDMAGMGFTAYGGGVGSPDPYLANYGVNQMRGQ